MAKEMSKEELEEFIAEEEDSIFKRCQDIANKRFGMFKNWKFTAKVHEYLLVFKKEVK